ncbi:hypothetical protein GCM10009662_35950 [Catellatospora coxensis]|uniref:Uncharacterized protein n=2 Tax=Catellatospora coxensis TaxID=310354 RepID=A0A8J3KX43_9ACTN|nr:hypothetical protein Cco03nite_16890 [Catellatospora coxensis]
MWVMGHGDMEARLAAAAEAHRERQTAVARHRELLRLIDDAAALVRELSQAHAREVRDVVRLETVTLTRVIAALRGTRHDAIARERAEADAAAYRLGRAEADVAALRGELDGVAARLSALEDAPGRYAAALDEKERVLAAGGDSRARRLLDLAEARGVAEAELKEIREAQHAAAAASKALHELRRLLDSADGWSTYDTFFGGGMISSAIKHDRLDEAAKAAALADQRIAALNAELADVPGGGAATALAISGLTRFLDVWFDNIFTDLAVRDRIKQALAGAKQCDEQVGRIGQQLDGRHAQVRARLAQLAADREQTLTTAA